MVRDQTRERLERMDRPTTIGGEMKTCPSCAAQNPDDARFCSACGAATAASPQGSRPYTLFAGVVVAGLAAGIGISWLLFADRDSSTDTAQVMTGSAEVSTTIEPTTIEPTTIEPTTIEPTSASSEALPTSAPSTTGSATARTPESTSSPTVTLEVVPVGEPYTFSEIALEGGLFCRDIVASGRSYHEAVRYWYREGAPDRMDADFNGIPCETVFDVDVVADFWGVSHPELAVETVARELLRCDYEVTHVVSTEDYPDGTFDVKVRVDTDLDQAPDQTGLFNVYVGFDVYPTGDLEVDSSTSNGLYECRY